MESMMTLTRSIFLEQGEQNLTGIVWQFLKMLKVELGYDPAITLLDIYPRELKTCPHKNLYPNIQSNVTP